MIEDKTRELPLYISNGGLSDWRRCPARYYFKHLLGIEAAGSNAPPLEYGIAIHRAVAYVQRGDLDTAIDVFRSSWKASGCEEDNKRNILNAQKLLSEFYRRQITQKQRPYTIIEPPETDFDETYSDQEFDFCMELTNHEIPLIGRIDAICQNNMDGKYWGIEYKTTSELGQRFLNAFEINSQVLGYTSVLAMYFGAENVDGFYLEAFRVSSATAMTTTVPIYVHSSQVELFLETFENSLNGIVQSIENGKFLQDVSACTTYNQHGSPGYLCEFAPLCKAKSDDEFHQRLQSCYVERKKSPFHQLLKK